MNMACLALLFLSLACSGNKDRTSPSLSLVFLGGQDVVQVDKGDLLARIRKARSDSTQSDLLDQLENEVNGWDDDMSKSGEPQRRATSFVSLTRRIISRGPHDFETQLVAVSTLFGLSYTMENLAMDFTLVRKEAIDATKALARRFPKEDRAHAQLGSVLLYGDKSNADAARSEFEICLELNPSNRPCRDALSRVAGL